MNNRRALVIFIVATMLCLGWWYIIPTPKELPPDTVAQNSVSSPPTTSAIQQFQTRTAQVAAPVVLPAKLGPIGQIVAARSTGDPRLELDTAMADFLRMVNAGDYVTAVDMYVHVPPDETADQFVNELVQDPDFPSLVQLVKNEMQAIQKVTPVYNDTGDLVTYTFTTPINGKEFMRWNKVGNQWFLDSLGD